MTRFEGIETIKIFITLIKGLLQTWPDSRGLRLTSFISLLKLFFLLQTWPDSRGLRPQQPLANFHYNGLITNMTRFEGIETSHPHDLFPSKQLQTWPDSRGLRLAYFKRVNKSCFKLQTWPDSRGLRLCVKFFQLNRYPLQTWPDSRGLRHIFILLYI